VIHLAVRGAEAIRRQLELRLRDATVASSAGDDAPPNGCDAVAFLESRPSDASSIRRCLEARQHVLLVAQPWLTGDVLDGLADEASRSGAHLAVLNPDRFLPSRQLIRQQLDSGRLGQPGLVRSHRWEHAATVAHLGGAAPECASAAADVPTPVARELDVALWLMGTAPNLVYARSPGGDPGDSPSGRSMQVHLGFPGGGMALIDYVDSLPAGDGYRSLSVIGSTGAAYADDLQNVQLVYGGGHPKAVVAGEGGRELVALVQDFVSGLSRGLAPTLPASTTAWRTAMAVAGVARTSAATRQAVPLESA